MTEDPWKDLSPPSVANTINARRVDVDTKWGFFWARGIDGKCLFVILHGEASDPSVRLPRLQGVDVSTSDWPEGQKRVLVFRLEDSSQRDLFHRLCLDIVSCASEADSEREVLLLAIARTWRWHHLLRGGGDRRLSAEEQKGLIGELLVLERHLLPSIGCVSAVNSWRGPLGSPKDFEIGHTYIEVKARRGAAAPYITISSESQLDEGEIGLLLLYVVDLDHAPPDSEDRFTLADVASRVHDAIGSLDQGGLETYEGLLSASGFRWDDEYTDSAWIEGVHRVYKVCGRFPRIVPTGLLPGVSDVRYSVSLVDCQPFVVSTSQLNSMLQGGPDVPD